MLITKEQQEAWVDAYVKEKHNADECIGFIDGINKALEVVKNNLVKPDVIKSLPDSYTIFEKARENDEKDFDRWWWETVYKGNVL